ncbi:chaperonin [Tulasnella sp. 427]|nr:chaperonin [Tulasnella sp. 427]
MAILTGGTVFPDELDIKLETATADFLGDCGSNTFTKEDTIFLKAFGRFDEKKDRYDDALNATLATVGEGILPGDGVALLEASLFLTALEESAENFDRKLGTVDNTSTEAPAREKVVQTAFVDASGIASLLTTSKVFIVEAPGDKPGPTGMPGMGGF